MANLMGWFEVVALGTGDEGRKKHAEVAAPFSLSRFGIFPFR